MMGVLCNLHVPAPPLQLCASKTNSYFQWEKKPYFLCKFDHKLMIRGLNGIGLARRKMCAANDNLIFWRRLHRRDCSVFFLIHPANNWGLCVIASHLKLTKHKTYGLFILWWPIAYKFVCLKTRAWWTLSSVKNLSTGSLFAPFAIISSMKKKLWEFWLKVRWTQMT